VAPPAAPPVLTTLLCVSGSHKAVTSTGRPCSPQHVDHGPDPTSQLPFARVADRCGFGSSETLRQAFDLYGRTPSEHRRALRVPARAVGRR